MKKFLASLGILSLVLALAAPVLAADTVTATVTPQIIAVSVADGTVVYGILDVDQSNNTSDGTALETQTISNDSNVSANITLRSSDAAKTGEPDVTDWALAGTAAPNVFVHSYDIDTVTPAWTVFPADGTFDNTYTSTVVTLTESGGIGPTATLDLKIDMPTSTSDTSEHSITVTVLATAP